MEPETVGRCDTLDVLQAEEQVDRAQRRVRERAAAYFGASPERLAEARRSYYTALSEQERAEAHLQQTRIFAQHRN